jgi:hypothetical protein
MRKGALNAVNDELGRARVLRCNTLKSCEIGIECSN